MSATSGFAKLVGVAFLIVAFPVFGLAIAGLMLLSWKGILVAAILGTLANYYHFFSWGRDEANSRFVRRSLWVIFLLCGVIATALSPLPDKTYFLVEFFGAMGLAAFVWFWTGVYFEKR